MGTELTFNDDGELLSYVVSFSVDVQFTKEGYDLIKEAFRKVEIQYFGIEEFMQKFA